MYKKNGRYSAIFLIYDQNKWKHPQLFSSFGRSINSCGFGGAASSDGLSYEGLNLWNGVPGVTTVSGGLFNSHEKLIWTSSNSFSFNPTRNFANAEHANKNPVINKAILTNNVEVPIKVAKVGASKIPEKINAHAIITKDTASSFIAKFRAIRLFGNIWQIEDAVRHAKNDVNKIGTVLKPPVIINEEIPSNKPAPYNNVSGKFLKI